MFIQPGYAGSCERRAVDWPRRCAVGHMSAPTAPLHYSAFFERKNDARTSGA